MRTSDLIPDAVQDRLAEVSEDRLVAKWRHMVETPERAHESLLDQVFGVDEVTCIGRQAAPGPEAKAGQETDGEELEGPRIPVLSPAEEILRGLIVRGFFIHVGGHPASLLKR